MGEHEKTQGPDVVLLASIDEKRGSKEKSHGGDAGAEAADQPLARAARRKTAKTTMSVAEAISGLSRPLPAATDAFGMSHVFGEEDEEFGLQDGLDSQEFDTRAAQHCLTRWLGIPRPVIERLLIVREFLLPHVESLKVQMVVFFVIIFDFVFSFWHSNTDHSIDKSMLDIIEATVLGILSLDIFARMVAQGRTFWIGPSRHLNRFEVAVVLLCVSQAIFSDSKLIASFALLRGIGRVAKFLRPLIMTCQHRHAIISAAARTAQHKVFDAMVKMIGDCVRVRPEDVHVDPMDGTFMLDHAEIRAGTFEGLHTPITILGGVVQHFWIKVPKKLILGGAKRSTGLMIKTKLCNAELVLGPVRQRWTYEDVSRSKGRLIELLYRRSDILAPIIKSRSQNAPSPAETSPQTTSINAKANRMANLKKQLMKQMMHHLLHDMSLEITNVCVRFESEQQEVSGLPFVCGLGLRSLTYNSSVPLKLNARTSSTSLEIEDRFNGPSHETRRLPKIAESIPVSSTSTKYLNRSASLMRWATNSLRKIKSSASSRSSVTSRNSTRDVSHDGQKLVIDQFEIYWDVHHGHSRHLTRRTYRAIEQLYSSGLDREASLMAAEAQRKFVANRAREAMKLRAISQIISKFSSEPEKERLMKGPMFRERFDEHYYVLFPVNATVRLEWRHGFNIGEPPKVVAVNLEHMRWAVDDRQLVSMNQMHAYLTRWSVENQCCITRPAYPILSKDDFGNSLKSAAKSSSVSRTSSGLGELLKEENELRRDTVRRWWQHAMRSCQIRLDFKPRLLATSMARYAAEEVQKEYVDLITQSMFREQLSDDSFGEIQDRVLQLQVRLGPIACLRLRQIAKDELRRLKKQALQTDVFDHANGEKDQAEMMKSKVETIITGINELALGTNSNGMQEEALEDEEDDNVFHELVEAEQQTGDQATRGNGAAGTASHGVSSVTGTTNIDQEGSSLRNQTATADGEATNEGNAENAIDLEAGGLVENVDEIARRAPIDLTLLLESIEMCVLSHSLWGAILKATSHHEQVEPSRSQPRRRSSKQAPIGGFGFERFGAQVMPRNMLCCVGVTTVHANLSIVFDAFDGGSATGSKASFTVSKIRGFSPSAPRAFQGMLEHDPGEPVCMEVKLQAVEEPLAEEAFSTNKSEAFPTLKSDTVTVKSVTTGATAGTPSPRPPEAPCPPASQKLIMMSSSSSAANSVASESKDGTQKDVRGMSVGVGQVISGPAKSSTEVPSNVAKSLTASAVTSAKAPEPDPESPPTKVGAKWAVKALLKARWDGSLRVSPIRATCFEPVMQRLVSMAKEGRRINQAREEFEIIAQLGHRREKKLSGPAKLFVKLQSFFPGSLSLNCDIGSVQMNAITRYAFKEVLSVQAAMPRLLPKLLVGGKPMQISMDLSDAPLEQLASKEGDQSWARLDADDEGFRTHAAMAQPVSANHLNRQQVREQREVGDPELAGATNNPDRAVLHPSSQSVEQSCMPLHTWRNAWASLWCTFSGQNTQVVESMPSHDMLPSLDEGSISPTGMQRKGADALAWAVFMSRSRRDFETVRPGPTANELLDVEDETASDWPGTLPFESMMRQLPWSLRVRTIKSTSVGLSQGNLLQKPEDYHFLDSASRKKLRRRSLVDNGSKVYEVVSGQAGDAPYAYTAAVREMLQEEVEIGVEGAHVDEDEIDRGDPLSTPFGGTGSKSIQSAPSGLGVFSPKGRKPTTELSSFHLGETVDGQKSDRMMDFSKEMDARLKAKLAS